MRAALLVRCEHGGSVGEPLGGVRPAVEPCPGVPQPHQRARIPEAGAIEAGESAFGIAEVPRAIAMVPATSPPES